MNVTEQMVEALKLFRQAKASIAADAYDGVDDVARETLETADNIAEHALSSATALSQADGAQKPSIWWCTDVNGRLTGACDDKLTADIWRRQGYIVKEAYPPPRSPQGIDPWTVEVCAREADKHAGREFNPGQIAYHIRALLALPREQALDPTLHDLVMIYERAYSAAAPSDSLAGNPLQWPITRGVKAVAEAVLASIPRPREQEGADLDNPNTFHMQPEAHPLPAASKTGDTNGIS